MVIGLLCDPAQVVPPRDMLYQEPNRHHVLPNGCKLRHQVGPNVCMPGGIHTLRFRMGQAYSPSFLMVPLLPPMPPAPGELELSFLWTTPGSRFNGLTHGLQPILLQRSSCPLSLHWLESLYTQTTLQLCNASRPDLLKTAISAIFSAAFSSSSPSMA